MGVIFHPPGAHAKLKFMRLYNSLLQSAGSGRLIAVLEQVAYTVFSLLIFAVAVLRYDASISALNLALVALMNLPVPFHAIQIGWRSNKENDLWLGSPKTQIILLCITIAATLAFAFASSIQVTFSTVLLFCVAGLAAVWSNGIRWIFIKHGKFTMLSSASLLTIPVFVAIEFLNFVPQQLSIYAAVVATKVIFTVALIWQAFVAKIVTIHGNTESQGVNAETIAFALSRFIRTHGVFTILSVLAPNAAIAGRLVQKAIGFCRVFQNPLANHTFFHERSFFGKAIRIQVIFGFISAALFFILQEQFDEAAPGVLGALAVFSGTLGFVGIFIMRYSDKRRIGLGSEALSAAAFLSVALLFIDRDGFLLGLILSDFILFAAGVLVFRSRGVASS